MRSRVGQHGKVAQPIQAGFPVRGQLLIQFSDDLILDLLCLIHGLGLAQAIKRILRNSNSYAVLLAQIVGNLLNG